MQNGVSAELVFVARWERRFVFSAAPRSALKLRLADKAFHNHVHIQGRNADVFIGASVIHIKLIFIITAPQGKTTF